MTKFSLPFMIAVVSAPLLLGCGPKSELSERRFEIAFHVKSDDGEALSGVTVATEGHQFGVTNESGTLLVRLKGTEGQKVPVDVSCPENFDNPETRGFVRLALTRRVGEEAPQAIPFEVECTRKMRQVVLIVHAPHGEDLPVHVGGVRQALTDERGIAHVLLNVDKDTRNLHVALDTAQRPELKPQNPSWIYELSGRDTLAVFDHEFVLPKPARGKPIKSNAPRKHIPYRVH